MEKKRKPKFKRTDFSKYSKLGVGRKKKQVYRRPKGIDNKIKLKMKGHLRRVMIGFGSNKKTRGLIGGLEPVQIVNINDLNKLTEGKIGIVAKVGMKRKIEIANAALNRGIRLANLNSKKFLYESKEEEEEREEKKIEREEKKKEKEKIAKKAEKEKENQEKVKEEVVKNEEGKEKVKEEVVKKEKEEIKEEKKKTSKKYEKKNKEIQTNNYEGVNN